MPLVPSNIALTAKLTACQRQLTGLPFTKDVARMTKAASAFANFLRAKQLKAEDLTWYAPILEARYRSVTEMILRSGARQVLELGSGFSMRGLAMTSDPALTYLETDLAVVSDEASALVEEISRRQRLPARKNLQVLAANALVLDDLLRAAENFAPGEGIAIVHEGLLEYLTSTETETVAANIHQLLEKFGGSWITPDFTMKADAALVSGPQQRLRQIMASAADGTMYNNAFDNTKHMNDYFGRLGFQVEVFNQLYLAPELASADLLPPGALEEMKPRLRLWVLQMSP